MGEFSKLLAQKSNQELTEIGDCILDYQSLFIIDYLSELEERSLLFDYKIFISNWQLIRIAFKIKDVSNTKYHNILLNEIDIRKLSNEYAQFLKNKLEEEKTGEGKKWYLNLFESILIIFFVGCIAVGYILYKQGIIFSRKEKNNNEIKLDLPIQKYTAPNFERPIIDNTLDKSSGLNPSKIPNKKIDSELIQSIDKINQKRENFKEGQSFELLNKINGNQRNALYDNPRFQLSPSLNSDTNHRMN